MIAIVLDIASWLCLLAGVLLGVTAGIGLVRLPDLFTRMHAAGIGDTLAAGLIFLGLALQAGLTINLVKLVLIMIFIILTSPTSTHALAKAALHGGVKPQLDPKEDDAPSKA